MLNNEYIDQLSDNNKVENVIVLQNLIFKNM
jgi:hypothetical protein